MQPGRQSSVIPIRRLARAAESMPLMDARELMARTCPATGDVGAAFYFHPDTVAYGKDTLGLDGFRFYFLGRGGVLGDVDPAVVHAAFGYFNPGLVAKMWTSAAEKVPPRDAARQYIECGHRLARSVLTDVDGLDAYAAAAGTIINAADDSALSLFAGLRAEEVPADPAAAAFHQAMVLRELRGSAHLVAVAAVGLTSVVAHQIKRPNDVQSFGWPEDLAAPTDAQRAALDRAEDITNEMLAPVFDAVDDAGADALIAGIDAMHAAFYPPKN